MVRALVQFIPYIFRSLFVPMAAARKLRAENGLRGFCWTLALLAIFIIMLPGILLESYYQTNAPNESIFAEWPGMTASPLSLSLYFLKDLVLGVYAYVATRFLWCRVFGFNDMRDDVRAGVTLQALLFVPFTLTKSALTVSMVAVGMNFYIPSLGIPYMILPALISAFYFKELLRIGYFRSLVIVIANAVIVVLPILILLFLVILLGQFPGIGSPI